MSNHPKTQFRVGTLLFLTFVVAICASLIQQSTILGCLATIPITFALMRTLRQPRSQWLVLTFAQSLWLLIALLAVSVFEVFVSVVAMTLLLAQFLIRVLAKATRSLWRQFVNQGIATVPEVCLRWVSVAGAFSLRLAQGLSVSIALWLHQTNRVIAAKWHSRAANH